MIICNPTITYPRNFLMILREKAPQLVNHLESYITIIGSDHYPISDYISVAVPVISASTNTPLIPMSISAIAPNSAPAISDSTTFNYFQNCLFSLPFLSKKDRASPLAAKKPRFTAPMSTICFSCGTRHEPQNSFLYLFTLKESSVLFEQTQPW